MKRVYSTYTMILLLAVSLGFINLGTQVSADATTTFQTGDRLTYVGDSFYLDYGENSFTAYIDPENNGTFFLGRDEWKLTEFVLDGNTSADVFVIRNERGFDSIFLINTNTEALPGSYWNATSYVYDSDPNVPPNDGNFSDYQDLSGQMDHEFNREDSSANATYAYMPPEFFAGDFIVPGLDFGGDAGFVLPDLSVSVTKSVSTGTGSYVINGQNFTNLSLRVFTMRAFGSIAGTMNITIPTPEFDAIAAMDYNVTYLNEVEFVYDSATGIPLEINRDEFFWVDGNFSTGAFTTMMYDEFGVPFNVTLDMSGDFFFENDNVENLQLAFASSHYGLARPVSFGDPPLKENDVLTYDWGQYGDFEISGYVQGEVFDENGTFMNNIISMNHMTSTEEGSGTTSVEVYRHYADAFEALIWTEGSINRQETSEESFYDGFQWNNNSFTSPVDTSPIMKVRPLFSSSNSSLEMWIPPLPSYPNPMFEGDDNADGLFGGDLFGLPIDFSVIPHDIPMTGSFVQTEGPYTYEINGFTFEFPVDVFTYEYDSSFSDTQYFDNYQIILSGSLSVTATDVYDPVTGVLVERGLDMSVTLSIQVMEMAQPAQNGPSEPGMHLVEGSLDLAASFSEWNVLTAHPHKYLEAPPTNNTSVPSSNSTSPTEPTDTNTSTSTANTSATTNGTTSSPSFESPLPGFEWAAPLTVFATLVILRKRRS